MASNSMRMKNVNLQIRKLPFSILQKLASSLDGMDNTKNWKGLIAAMPPSTYKQNEVNQFDRIGMQRGGSSAEALLQDLGHKCKTVKQLIAYLEIIGNNEALELLKPDEPVEIVVHPSSVPVMAGGTIELTCEATGFPQPEYQWLRNGEELRHGCESTLLINNAQAKDSGKYSCIVSNTLNAEKSNCAEVQVIDRVIGCQPPKIVQHPISAVVPIGQMFTLSCQAEYPDDCNYQWTINGYKLRMETSSVIVFDPFNYEHEGNYTCRVFNARGDALTRVATLQAWAPAEPSHQSDGIDQSSSLLNETATDKIALVIGNRDYINLPPNESPLVHTCGDAQSVAAILRKNVMNFKVISLVNLTSDEMNKAVSIYCDLLGHGVYGLLYFAGHGFEDSGQNYMIPIDAMADWTPDKAICVQEVLHKMHARRATLNVFLLDICRKMTMTSNGYKRTTYQYPPDAQSVIGFATCPGAEAYERKADANGLYMKHLLKNITKEIKVEDMLQKVAADVEEEVANDPDVWRMRPQYHSKTVKNFSLRDPIVTDDKETQKRNQKWLEIHKLPQKHIFNVADVGITVEIRFEHTNWLSNVILVCLRVLNLGEASMCDATLVLDALPKGFQECHFHPSTTNKMRHVVPPECLTTVTARAWKPEDEGSSVSPAPVPVERISEIYNIQRLKKNLSLTIELKYTLRGSQEEKTKYEIKAFNLKEFGIVSEFARAAERTEEFQDESL